MSTAIDVTREQLLTDALKAALVVINSIEFGGEGGTDCTGWGVCPECSRADFRGHKDDCAIAKVIRQAQNALEFPSYAEGLAESAIGSAFE